LVGRREPLVAVRNACPTFLFPFADFLSSTTFQLFPPTQIPDVWPPRLPPLRVVWLSAPFLSCPLLPRRWLLGETGWLPPLPMSSSQVLAPSQPALHLLSGPGLLCSCAQPCVLNYPPRNSPFDPVTFSLHRVPFSVFAPGVFLSFPHKVLLSFGLTTPIFAPLAPSFASARSCRAIFVRRPPTSL